MADDWYRLHDGALLRRLMERPPEGEAVLTVRSLAALVGLSYSKIQKLITEERPYVTEGYACRIASAVHCRRRALFSPSPSPYSNGDRDTETPHGPR